MDRITALPKGKEAREKLLLEWIQNGTIPNPNESVLERVVDALREDGPQTTRELSEKLNIQQRSFGTWGTKAVKNGKLAEVGIVRAKITGDGKSFLWFMKDSIGNNAAASPPIPFGDLPR